MRTLIIAVVVMVPVVASADIIGRVGLYTDQAGTNCMVDNSAPGLDEVYIVVDGLASGIISILFAAPVPECWTGATWLADVWPWELIIGDTQLNDPRGIAITGINCQVPTQYIGKMLINTQGLHSPAADTL